MIRYKHGDETLMSKYKMFKYLEILIFRYFTWWWDVNVWFDLNIEAGGWRQQIILGEEFKSSDTSAWFFIKLNQIFFGITFNLSIFKLIIVIIPSIELTLYLLCPANGVLYVVQWKLSWSWWCTHIWDSNDKIQFWIYTNIR